MPKIDVVDGGQRWMLEMDVEVVEEEGVDIWRA
jgi:hypothetical protein